MHVVDHHSLAELKRLARRQSVARCLKRLQVVILAKRGYTAPEVAEATGASRRSLQEWIRRYNADGLDGLKDRRHSGYRRHLSDDQEQQLMAYLDRKAADSRDGVRRGEDLRQWIAKQFDVTYTLDGVYKLLHRMGYSCLMPRPRHANADPNVQSAFKKTLWHRSNVSPKPIPTNVSRPGSRTRRALGNKAR